MSDTREDESIDETGFTVVNRLGYIEYDEKSMIISGYLRHIFTDLIRQIQFSFKDSREKALALTKLEETWVWIGKTIKVEQEFRESQ